MEIEELQLELMINNTYWDLKGNTSWVTLESVIYEHFVFDHIWKIIQSNRIKVNWLNWQSRILVISQTLNFDIYNLTLNVDFGVTGYLIYGIDQSNFKID